MEHTTNSAPDGQVPGAAHAAPPVDAVLRTLIRTIDRLPNGSSIGITLTLGGAVVTGQMIGQADYVELLSNAVASATADAGLASEVAKGLASTASDLGERDARIDAVRHVHMRDVRFHLSSGLPKAHLTLPLWRGRLSEVSGFALGEFSQG